MATVKTVSRRVAAAAAAVRRAAVRVPAPYTEAAIAAASSFHLLANKPATVRTSRHTIAKLGRAIEANLINVAALAADVAAHTWREADAQDAAAAGTGTVTVGTSKRAAIALRAAASRIPELLFERYFHLSRGALQKLMWYNVASVRRTLETKGALPHPRFPHLTATFVATRLSKATTELGKIKDKPNVKTGIAIAKWHGDMVAHPEPAEEGGAAALNAAAEVVCAKEEERSALRAVVYEYDRLYRENQRKALNARARGRAGAARPPGAAPPHAKGRR